MNMRVVHDESISESASRNQEDYITISIVIDLYGTSILEN